MRRLPDWFVLAALGGLVAGCAASPRVLLERGDAQLARQEYGPAARSYAEALTHPKSSALDQERAAIGEARAFIGKPDLVGAKTRLRRIDDRVSAKWYLLGSIALSEGDPSEARRCLEAALERNHRGDTALLLAGLVGGEARSHPELLSCAEILARGGHAAEAEGARAAAAVWRELLAGGQAPALLTRLDAAKPLEGYPAVRLLRARLLDRLGQPDEAATLWDLSGLSPPPSAEFLSHAAELRARLAIQQGGGGLESALESADAATAARVRAGLAAGCLWRGDLEGAATLYAATAEQGGAPAPLAQARLAETLTALGRSTPAAAAWKKAAAGETPEDRTLRQLLATRRAAQGDLLGAGELLAGGATNLGSPASELLAGSRLLGHGLAAWEIGDDPAAARLARAVLLLVPGDPVASILAGAAGTPQPGPAGSSAQALRRARLRRTLRAGDLAAAVRQLPGEGGIQDILEAELNAAFLRAAAGGGTDLRAPFLRQIAPAEGLTPAEAAARFSPAAWARLRASAPFGPLRALPEPRGLAALSGERALGSLVAPGNGRRAPRVALDARAGGWALRWPEGDARAYADVAEVGALLGAAPGELRFTWEPADDEAALAGARRAARATPWPAPPLEID